MTKDKLSRRMMVVRGTPLRDKPAPIDVMRRGKNYVEMELEDSSLHDDFFDFEKDLVNLQSSRNLAKNAPGAHSFFDYSENEVGDEKSSIEMVEEKTVVSHPKREKSRYIEMIEEASAGEKASNSDSLGMVGAIKLESVDEPSFEFVRCEALKKDGSRCKRQAPGDSTICSVHKKFYNKEDKR